MVTFSEAQALLLVFGSPGVSQRSAALVLGISRGALRSRVESGLRKIADDGGLV